MQKTVKPMAQALGWQAEALGGKLEFKQDARLVLGEVGSGASPIMPRQAPACPPLENLA